MYLMQPSDEKLVLSDKEWIVIYDAWQPRDFELLAKYGLDPKDYKLSNSYKEYQRVIRKSDWKIFYLYF